MLLSRAAMQASFSVLSVGHEGNNPVVPLVQLDLTTESGETILWDMLDSKQLVAVHLGLPCGTASLARARERPVSQMLQSQGAPNPPPLRSAECPLIHFSFLTFTTFVIAWTFAVVEIVWTLSFLVPMFWFHHSFLTFLIAFLMLFLRTIRTDMSKSSTTKALGFWQINCATVCLVFPTPTFAIPVPLTQSINVSILLG